jgi:hypothetical protein
MAAKREEAAHAVAAEAERQRIADEEDAARRREAAHAAPAVEAERQRTADEKEAARRRDVAAAEAADDEEWLGQDNDASEVFDDNVEMGDAKRRIGGVVVEAVDIEAECQAQVAFIQQRVELYNTRVGSLLTQYLAGHGNT